MFDWQLSGKTDVGRVRELNEDCILCNQTLGFVVLADGMGGHQGGEIASAMAVSSITQDLEAAAKSLNAGDEQSQNIAIGDLLENAVKKANAEIFATAETNEHYKGMGTTVVVALTHNNRLHFAHVGDSRLYRFSNKTLEQLTKDHSLVNELLDQGYYKSSEEAAQAGQKNVITRAVGIAADVRVDVNSVSANDKDVFLLCSDGLNDMISNDEISELIQNHSEHEALLNALIGSACDAGGRDNVSVILMQATKSSLLKKSLGWLFKS